jgi:5'-3' exonuclease
MKNKSDILLVVDGNNMAYRAKFKFQLSNKGIDVSVTYGFLKMMIPLIREHNAISVIVAWDAGIPKFRKELVPTYKTNRHIDEDPEERKDFQRQINDLHFHALPAMGIVSIMKRYVEADDIVYHASRISKIPTIIVSSDKDILQCVNDNVSVLVPSKGIIYTAETLQEEIGIPYGDYVHWRAIQGDSSDNIPGINGIGEKTATKLFQTYKSLVGIENAALGVNPIGKIEGKIRDGILGFGRERIINNVKVMSLFRDLSGARKEILDEVEYYQPASRTRTMNYLMKNGFASLVDIIPGLTSKLVKPELNLKERFPIVCNRRIPI